MPAKTSSQLLPSQPKIQQQKQLSKKRRTFRTYFGGKVSSPLTKTQQKQLEKNELHNMLEQKGVNLAEDGLVGSGLGKDENSNNQTEIEFNQLSRMTANASEVEDNSDTTLVFGGYPILMMHELDRETAKNCTISFFTLYTDSPGCGDDFPIGILTSSLCSPVADGETNVVNVFTRDKLLYLGDLMYMTFGENNEVNDFDYALADVF
ncbi:10184_t:CDS:2, partial [Ambispora gerdemannii]